MLRGLTNRLVWATALFLSSLGFGEEGPSKGKSARSALPVASAEMAHTQVRMGCREAMFFVSAVSALPLPNSSDNSPAKILKERYGSQWASAVSAFREGELSSAQMSTLLQFRREILERAVEITKKFYSFETQDVGSSSLTSDIDLTISGRDAVAAFAMLNRLLRAGFGGLQGGFSLDIRFYTEPVYSALPPSPHGNDIDEIGALFQLKKYSLPSEWRRFTQSLISGFPEGPTRDRYTEHYLPFVEQTETSLKWLTAIELAKLGNRSPDREEAAGAKYYQAFLSAMDRAMRAQQSQSGSGAGSTGDQVDTIRRLQTVALYFAPEAYVTNSAIEHVVSQTQATHRKISANTLLDPERPAVGGKVSQAMARRSFIEQYAYILFHVGALRDSRSVESAEKVAKYLLRAFDAAQIAGLQLAPGYRRLVEETSAIEEGRKLGQPFAAATTGGNDLSPESAAKAYIDRALGAIYPLATDVASQTRD